MTEEKRIRWTVNDAIGWLKAYPNLNDPIEKVIWKALFRDLRKYWLQVLLATLAIELVWQAVFKWAVLLLLWLDFQRTAWFFD